jgi:hypothetical protein
MKYRVTGKADVWVSIIVEADSKESAIEQADRDFGGVGGFAGNGGSNKLIGVTGSKESIESGDFFEFDAAEEYDD